MTTLTPLLVRKKPVVVETVQLTAENLWDVQRWIEAGGWYCEVLRTAKAIRIQTLEGDMLGSLGDWVVRGVAGEFYPVRGDIFAETYELARGV